MNQLWNKHSSTAISQSGYDPEQREMYIKFKGGQIYAYQNVTQATYDNFLDSESKGGYFNANIRGLDNSRV